MSKLNEIIEIIKSAKDAYYQTGRSNLTDAEYDDLVSKAEKLGYIETVGAAPVDNIAKIPHEHPMLSLNKVHTAAEIAKFTGNKDVVYMWKADGLSISCTYEDGVLTRLETRGDGAVGNDIMFHAKSFLNLPLTIGRNGRFVIDGECVILRRDFEAINEKMTESERFSNPRNLAAGSLNQLDPAVSAQRRLRFYAWDIIEGGTESHCKNMMLAETLGFDVVMYRHSSEFDLDLDTFRLCALADGFPIDGVVIKYDNLEYGRSLGATNHHPLGAVAYKFEDDKYPSKLIKVDFQIGKTGQLTPVAYFEPVEIDGSIVEKASLHNLTIMSNLHLTKGCTVYVYKANCIIPQIDCADPDGTGEIEIPEFCPVCGSPTRVLRENDSEVLVCTNDDCPGKLLGKWKYFVSKKAMDINGLSEQTLDRFLKCGFLTSEFESIYHLSDYQKELYKLDGFGKKSIDNILAAIEKSKDVDLQHFITAFSIPNIGEGQAKLICAVFKTFEDFADACEDYNFAEIPGIGSVLNGNIHRWWAINQQQMKKVASIVRFKGQKNEAVGTSLCGKTFVITGNVFHFKNRDELKEKIESLGGKVGSGVSKNTSYLINNDVASTSGKNKKAQELNVPIISEDDFLKMIGE